MNYCVTEEEKRTLRALVDAKNRHTPGANEELNHYEALLERTNRRCIWKAMIAAANGPLQNYCTNEACGTALPRGYDAQLCERCRVRRARQRVARAQHDTQRTCQQVASFDTLFDEAIRNGNGNGNGNGDAPKQ
jgi:hypothetical protein